MEWVCGWEIGCVGVSFFLEGRAFLLLCGWMGGSWRRLSF